MNGFIKMNCIWVLLLVLAVTSCTRKENARMIWDMNTDWAFYRRDMKHGEDVDLDDFRWMPATIPHIMQLEKKHCGGDVIYNGIGWYRRYFKLPENYADKRIAVSFEGVMNACELFVNGHKVTEHKGGYIGFTSDISDYINWNGNNLLALRVSAEYDSLTPPGKPQDRLDFYYYSGIYRDVKMIITDKLHISDELENDDFAGSGLFITYPKVEKEEAQVSVRTGLKNGHQDTRNGILQSVLRDEKGKVVAEQDTPFSLAGGNDSCLAQTLTVSPPPLASLSSASLSVGVPSEGGR